MPANDEYYEFYFKIVYTERTIHYRFSPTISIKNFIETVNFDVRRDFNILNNQKIEIVEAGQPNNINGRDAEMAPALEPVNETLREIYGNRHNNVAFYIRIIL
jgi:hypothetical protein